MEKLIPMAMAVLFDELKDKKTIVKYADALAKLYWLIHFFSTVNPTVAAAIEKKRPVE